MISKKTFKELLDVLENHVTGISELETCLNVTFVSNFLIKTIDRTIVILGESFFTEQELKDENNRLTVNTVVDNTAKVSKNGTVLVFGLINAVLVLAAAGAGAYFLVLKKKPAKDAE